MFPLSSIPGLPAFLGKKPNFVSNEGLKKVLRKNLSFERLEDAQLPITVMATEIQTGAEVRLTEGPAIDAILASTSLPGVFPPIKIGGRSLVDGGIANNTPISAAIAASVVRRNSCMHSIRWKRSSSISWVTTST